jgi:Cu/Ag efflux protein CusF
MVMLSTWFRIVRVVATAASLAVALFAFASAYAEVIELEGVVKAVDAEDRSITIERKTAKGTKTLELEVAKKAGNLSAVKVGDSVSFSYDPSLEIVTGIGGGTTARSGSGLVRGNPIRLIQPNSLEGWEFEKPVDEPTWAVSDGVLICTGEGPNLKTTGEFEDFELKGEFLLPSRGNSGIFFGPNRRHEFALIDSLWRNSKNEQARPDERTGAIYGKVAPKDDAYVGPNKWNRFVLTVNGNTVTAEVNDRQVQLNQKLEDESGSPQPAPLVLQRHGTTIGIKFRNLIITPLSAK